MTKKIFLFAPALVAALVVGCKNNENPKNVITDEKALSSFVADVNSGKTFKGEEIVLKKDIEFKNEWIPIGTKDHQFLGKFNGNGHKLTIKSTSEGAEGLEEGETVMGLFGYAGKDSEITNLTVDADFSQSKAYIVGGIYGSTNSIDDGGSININNVSINGSIFSEKYSGGLIGQAQGHNIFNISNAKVNADIDTNGYRAGGLFASLSQGAANMNKGIIANCEFAGTLKATKAANNRLWIGGFAGQVGSEAEFKVDNFKMSGTSSVEVSTPYVKDDEKEIWIASNKLNNAYVNRGLNATISLFEDEKPIVGSFSSSYVTCSMKEEKTNYAIELSDSYFEYKYNSGVNPASTAARAIIDKNFNAKEGTKDINFNHGDGEWFDVGDCYKSCLLKKDGQPYFGSLK